jgi:hypothetical protein
MKDDLLLRYLSVIDMLARHYQLVSIREERQAIELIVVGRMSGQVFVINISERTVTVEKR